MQMRSSDFAPTRISSLPPKRGRPSDSRSENIRQVGNDVVNHLARRHAGIVDRVGRGLRRTGILLIPACFKIEE
jgi:hypothetical protein